MPTAPRTLPSIWFSPTDSRTVTVDQEQNNGVWMFLSTSPPKPEPPPPSPSATTARTAMSSPMPSSLFRAIAPWAPAADKPPDYTLAPVDENFDGATLEHVRSGAPSRPRRTQRLRRTPPHQAPLQRHRPIGSATTADLENEANWAEGGIVADHAQKFGYHEARLRLPASFPPAAWTPPTGTVPPTNCSTATKSTPRSFSTRTPSGGSNNYGFGVWDHVLPTRARPGSPPAAPGTTARTTPPSATPPNTSPSASSGARTTPRSSMSTARKFTPRPPRA